MNIFITILLTMFGICLLMLLRNEIVYKNSIEAINVAYDKFEPLTAYTLVEKRSYDSLLCNPLLWTKKQMFPEIFND